MLRKTAAHLWHVFSICLRRGDAWTGSAPLREAKHSRTSADTSKHGRDTASFIQSPHELDVALELMHPRVRGVANVPMLVKDRLAVYDAEASAQ